MKVRTLQPHPYPHGVVRAVGEEYDMHPDHYPVMSAMRHVIRIDESPVLRTRDLEAEPPKQYRRRDLQSK